MVIIYDIQIIWIRRDFCDCKIVNSPQGDGVIIFPVAVPSFETLAEQDIQAWNAAASKAVDYPERF
jgi:hypothetical protein